MERIAPTVKSPLITKYADIVMFTGDTESSFYSETMSSRMSQLAIVDMLYMGVVVSDYRKYTKRLDKINNMAIGKIY